MLFSDEDEVVSSRANKIQEKCIEITKWRFGLHHLLKYTLMDNKKPVHCSFARYIKQRFMTKV